MGFFKPNVQKMQEQKDIPGLINALADSHADVPVAAINALVQIGEQVIGPLITALNANTSVRFQTIPVLARMVLQLQEDEPRQRALNAICKALKDKDSSVRLTAALTLKAISKQIKDMELLDEIQSALTGALSDLSPKVCQVIIEALGQFGDSAGTSLMMAAFMVKHPTARRLAIETLGSIQYAQAVEPLLGALRSKDGEERILIIKVLGQIGDARAVRPLLDTIDAAQNDALRGTLLIGASETPQQTYQRLQMVQKYKDAVTSALRQIGASALEQLILALRDENKWVRVTVGQLLREIVDSRAVEPLVPALRDENVWVREMAASLLGEIGDSRAVGPLIAALKDENQDVRQSAAIALGKCGVSRDAGAIEPLQASLEDTDERVRIAAGEALAKINGT